jgi:hypothetical protein
MEYKNSPANAKADSSRTAPLLAFLQLHQPAESSEEAHLVLFLSSRLNINDKKTSGRSTMSTKYATADI